MRLPLARLASGALVVALLALIAVTDPVAHADGWPQYRGPLRSGVSAETGLLQRWPDGGPTKLWTVSGIGAGYSSPAIAGDRVYVTGLIEGKGVLKCFDTRGKLQWTVSYGDEYQGGSFRRRAGKPRFRGARTTPTVHDGAVYLLSGAGVVGCYDAQTGAKRWAVDVLATYGGRQLKWGISESLLVTDGKLIVTPGGADAALVALDPASGKLIWRTKGLSHASAYCSPLLATHDGKPQIITHTADAIVGVSPADGSVLWQHAYRNMRAIHPVTPVYADGHVFATSGYSHGAVILKLGGPTPTEVWREKIMDTHHGGLVVLDGHVYGSSSNRPRGKWMCVGLTTGKIKYQVDGIGKGACIAAEGKLYCYGESGTVALVEATPTGWKQLGAFQITVGEDEHWAHPAIANGVLYIRHGDVMLAFDIRARQ